MNKNKQLKNYIRTRTNDLLGGMLTIDDRIEFASFIANLISDLSRSEAEILSLSLVNKDAQKYSEKAIKDGNVAYAEYKDKQKEPN